MLSYAMVLLLLVIVALLWSMRNSAEVIIRQLFRILETRRGEPHEPKAQRDEGELPDLLRGIPDLLRDMHEHLEKIAAYMEAHSRELTGIKEHTYDSSLDLSAIKDSTQSCSNSLDEIECVIKDRFEYRPTEADAYWDGASTSQDSESRTTIASDSQNLEARSSTGGEVSPVPGLDLGATPAPRPVLEPGWKLLLGRYTAKEANAFRDKVAKGIEDSKLVPDANRPGRFWIAYKPKPKP